MSTISNLRGSFDTVQADASTSYYGICIKPYSCIEISGAPSTGKSTLAMRIAAFVQNDMPVIYVDTEHSYDTRWAVENGINNSLIAITYTIPDIVSTNVLVIVDSYKSELSDSINRLVSNGACVICISQIRDNTQSGGVKSHGSAVFKTIYHQRFLIKRIGGIVRLITASYWKIKLVNISDRTEQIIQFLFKKH